MIGLIYLVALILYLVISFFIVMECCNYYKRRHKRCWVGALVGVVIAYNIVFWDLIPVYSAHEYYCRAESGVYTLTAPATWLAANPSERGRDLSSKYSRSEYLGDGRSRSWRSDQLYIEYNEEELFFGLIRRFRASLVDASNQHPLLEMTDYVSNYGALMLGGEDSSFKFWLRTGYCPGNLLEEFTRQLNLYR